MSSRSGHHCPRILTTGRHGCWAECRCGWVSRAMTTAIGATHEWALHVRAAVLRRRKEASRV